MGWNQRRGTKDDFNFRLGKLKFDMNYSTGKKFRSKVCSIWSRLYLRHMRQSQGKRQICKSGSLCMCLFQCHLIEGFPSWLSWWRFCLQCRRPGLDPRNSYPLQYSGVVNSMDCIVDGVTKNQTQLSDFHTHTHTHTHVIECTYLRRTITGEE